MVLIKIEQNPGLPSIYSIDVIRLCSRCLRRWGCWSYLLLALPSAEAVQECIWSSLMEMERKLNVLPVRTFLSRGVTGVKCAHGPHFQPNCHFPQNFAFRRNKVASDFRTQGERESDLGQGGSDTGKKVSLCNMHTDSKCWQKEENERILEEKKLLRLSCYQSW